MQKKRKRELENLSESEDIESTGTQQSVEMILELEAELEPEVAPEEVAPEEGTADDQTDWIFEAKFKSEEELVKYLEENGSWSKRGSDKRTGKIRWRCCLVTFNGPQCAKKKYSIPKYDDNRSDDDGSMEEVIYLYTSNCEHNHDQLPNKVKKVSKKMKERIIDMHKEKKKPMTISLRIGDDETVPDSEQPSKRQIYNVIESFKKKEFGSGPLTMGELTAFVNQYRDEPEDEDTAFILTFERSPPNQADNKFFRFFVTTKRLLMNAIHAKNIHADATEKIMVEKTYLLVVGTTDMKKSFHLIGILLSSHQDADSYEQLFSSVQSGVEQCAGWALDPDYIVSDADAAIALGSKRVWPGKPVLTCYVHLLRNVTKRYAFKDITNKEQFVADIRVLHNSPSEQVFDVGVDLFVKKWQKAEPDVIKRLQRSYFNQHKNWFIGAGKRVPKHNNGIENFNGQWKSYSTEYLKKPLKQYLFDFLPSVQQRSKLYRHNKLQPFQTNVEVTPEMLESGYKYNLREYVTIGPNEKGEIDFYIFASTESDLITVPDVEQFLVEKYRTFNDFAKKAFRIWKIVFKRNINDWTDAYCTCPTFNSEYMCKHVVAIAIDLGALPQKDPEEENYDDEPLFQSKRGRPKAVAPGSALLIE